MKLLESDIKKFRSIYKTKFGIDLDYRTARSQLSKLVRQLEIVYQPLRKEQIEKFIENEDVKENDDDNRMATMAH